MPSIRHISGISIAIAAGAVVLALLMVTTGTVTAFSRIPAEFLPAENTIAVFHNADTSLLAQYSNWLPELKNITLAEPTTVAIIKMETGAPAIITFRKQAGTATPLQFWPYIVESATPAAIELLQKRLQPLMKNPGYRDFSRSKKIDDHWVYVRTDALPHETSAYNAIVRALLLQDATSVGITSQGKDLTIELYKPSTDFRTAPEPISLGNTTTMAISVSNVRDLLERAWAQISVTQHQVFTALVQAFVQKNFGDNISGKYDLLPLIEKEFAFSVQQTTSGDVLLLAQGKNDPATLTTKVERLQASRRTMLPNSEVLDMQLDNQFHMRSLRVNDDQVTDPLQITIENDTVTLRTNDNVNDHSMERLLPSTLLASTIRSRGYVQIAPVRSLLETQFAHQAVQLSLPIFPSEAESVRWLWEERGSLAVIHLIFNE